jgi:lysophospholipid acyltransferase (LPLAT)-like uncharacterized protein
MLSFKRIARSYFVQKAIGVCASEYLRLVRNTSRVILEPADLYERWHPDLPFIAAMWHGQHFLTPFAKPDSVEVKVLVSRHRDGEINAIAAERLGIGTIRGSGDHGRRYDRKGGVGAFMNMLKALEQGYIVAMTADVPKVSRIAGNGIVTLAQLSGRPIYPFTVATSRRIQFDNWDRSALNLPFSRMAIVFGEPIRVPRDANDMALENYRQQVERGLNAVIDRAYAIVDGTGKVLDRG